MKLQEELSNQTQQQQIKDTERQAEVSALSLKVDSLSQQLEALQKQFRSTNTAYQTL
jgi:polyhydroxyalkanoate synthesis regulator phasin